MWTTAPWPVPCSTEWRDPSPRSPPTVRTTKTVSTPASPPATPRRPWSCPPAPAPRSPEAPGFVPPRAPAVPSETAEGEPTQRDRHLRHIAEHGRMAWQKASGYTRRARAEAAIGRWKQVIGDRLRAHADQRRATEVDVAVHALNRMLELGRPSYVRTA